MPAFPAPKQARAYALLAAATLPWLVALPVRHGPTLVSRPEDAPVIKAGLAAWRKPGGKLNAACSSCHSPDGFDLAVFNFRDEDVRRRAKMHVSAEEAERIVQMLHAVRRKYGIARPLDPTETRPFQPGGKVLPGASAVERDTAFGRSLANHVPTLIGERVDSLAKAQKARDEVLAVNVWDLPIGIPFNRWSEDVFHGKGRGLLADWIADLPRAPKPDKAAEWFALQDEYIAEPSEANMWRLLQAADTHTQQFSTMNFATLSTHKYRSMLLAQHLLREQSVAVNAPRRQGSTLFAGYTKGEIPSPIWDVGEYAALNMLLDFESQGMPDEVFQHLSPEIGMPKHMSEIRPAWLWLGWLMDQGLQRTPGDANTKTGRYFTLSLWEDGPYAMHGAFMIFRKQMVQSFDPIAMPEGVKQRFVLDYSELGRPIRAKRFLPEDHELRRMFSRFACNAMRASLYLLMEDLKQNGRPERPNDVRFHIEMCAEFLSSFSADSKEADAALTAQAIAALNAVK